MSRDERNISAVPWAVQALVIVALMGQLHWGMTRGVPTIKVAALSQPPSISVLRIMAFGDSLVHGYGLNQSETFPSQLEAVLRDEGHDVRVIRLPRHGASSVNFLFSGSDRR